MTYIFWKFNIWITYHLYSWQVCQILYLPSDSGKWNHESLAVTQVSWSKPICYRRSDIEPTNPLIDWPTELGWTLSLIIFLDCERCGTNKLMSLLLTVKVICNLVWDLLSILNEFFFSREFQLMTFVPDDSFLLSDQRHQSFFWCRRGLNIRSFIQPSFILDDLVLPIIYNVTWALSELITWEFL